jgi:hypothetical protein
MISISVGMVAALGPTVQIPDVTRRGKGTDIRLLSVRIICCAGFKGVSPKEKDPPRDNRGHCGVRYVLHSFPSSPASMDKKIEAPHPGPEVCITDDALRV